jgi:hypothetical protein
MALSDPLAFTGFAVNALSIASRLLHNSASPQAFCWFDCVFTGWDAARLQGDFAAHLWP